MVASELHGSVVAARALHVQGDFCQDNLHSEVRIGVEMGFFLSRQHPAHGNSLQWRRAADNEKKKFFCSMAESGVLPGAWYIVSLLLFSRSSVQDLAE